MGLFDTVKDIVNDSKEVDLGELFIREIDRFIMSRPDREESLAIKPSSYYKCIRALFYQLNMSGKKQAMTAKSRRILDVGTQLHCYIQDELLAKMGGGYQVRVASIDEIPSLNKEGLTVVKEHNSSPIEVKFRDTRFTDTIPISAMVDGVLTVANKFVVFEFKTINDKGFKMLAKPLDDHIMQGGIYALCLGINDVMFVYMNKDTQELKAFVHNYTEEKLSEVMKRIATVERAILGDTVPTKEESFFSCKYCNFKAQCNLDE